MNLLKENQDGLFIRSLCQLPKISFGMLSDRAKKAIIRGIDELDIE